MNDYIVVRKGLLTCDPAEFSDVVSEIASHLYDTAATFDQTISADRATGRIVVTVIVESSTLDDAAQSGGAAIRSALHAAGVATETWTAGTTDSEPRRVLTEEHLDIERLALA